MGAGRGTRRRAQIKAPSQPVLAAAQLEDVEEWRGFVNRNGLARLSILDYYRDALSAAENETGGELSDERVVAVIAESLLQDLEELRVYKLPLEVHAEDLKVTAGRVGHTTVAYQLTLPRARGRDLSTTFTISVWSRAEIARNGMDLGAATTRVGEYELEQGAFVEELIVDIAAAIDRLLGYQPPTLQIVFPSLD